MTICLQANTIKRFNGQGGEQVDISDVPEGSGFHAVDTGEEFIYHDGMWIQDMRRINAIKMAAE